MTSTTCQLLHCLVLLVILTTGSVAASSFIVEMVQHYRTYKSSVGLSLVDNTAYLPLAGGTLTGAYI
jgi:hypothetical protein